MPTYEKATKEVMEIAAEVLTKHDSHKPLLDAKVKIDYLFALPGKDKDGNPVGDAIRFQGMKATALARKIGLKERTKGFGDCEILIDKEWWDEATDKQKEALLDHELTHFQVRTDEDNVVQRDDLGRPTLKIRAHDFQVGWFRIVADRNGEHSQEVIQAEAMFDRFGQSFMPFLKETAKAA